MEGLSQHVLLLSWSQDRGVATCTGHASLFMIHWPEPSHITTPITYRGGWRGKESGIPRVLKKGETWACVEAMVLFRFCLFLLPCGLGPPASTPRELLILSVLSICTLVFKGSRVCGPQSLSWDLLGRVSGPS